MYALCNKKLFTWEEQGNKVNLVADEMRFRFPAMR